MQLDYEEQLGKMCPSCRKEAESNGCLRCGKKMDKVDTGYNPNFDKEKFERMKRGG